MNNSEKTVLVVGASGAFGSAITKRLLTDGYTVLATARNTDAIDESTLKLKLDLEDQNSIDLLVKYLLDHNIQLHGIIQAAGVVGFGKVIETSAQESQRLMQINNLGPANLISRLKPLLQEGSYVLSITGVVAERVFPGMVAYCSSKMAFASFLAGINTEWRRDKIQILDARPGHTETGLSSRAIFGTAPAFPEGMTKEHVIEVIFKALAEGKGILASSEF
jgi:cyclic-di-GMP-binding biofilm dispersal mediator protein